ncbi:hypothetical protein D3C76_1695180 [compost metagenome]
MPNKGICQFASTNVADQLDNFFAVIEIHYTETWSQLLTPLNSHYLQIYDSKPKKSFYLLCMCLAKYDQEAEILPH